MLEAKLLVGYYEVLTANDGATALEIVADAMPDIVLLDVMMPGMDGFEVCQKIKGNPARAHIPVVMVTALSEVSDRVKGLEAGADDFLTKPVSAKSLLARLLTIIENPRPFIKTEHYSGLDRRRHDMGPPHDIAERRSGEAVAAEEAPAELSPEEVLAG